MKLKRYPKKVLTKKRLKKFYAEQRKLHPIVETSEPHTIVRCCKCDSAKLKFDVTGDNELYYVCECGYESEPCGLAPARFSNLRPD